MTAGSSAGDVFSAANRPRADGPSITPTGILSGALSRNANPSASARSMGKMNTQKIASGSRPNSFVRAIVSSIKAGRIRLLMCREAPFL